MANKTDYYDPAQFLPFATNSICALKGRMCGASILGIKIYGN